MGDIYDNDVHRWLERESGATPPDDAGLQKVVAGVDRLSVPAKQTKEEAWAALEGLLEDEEEESISIAPETEEKGKTIRLMPYFAVAASVALVFVAYWVLNGGNTEDPALVQMATVTAPVGASESVALPDASEVTLNADSKIEYAATGWEEERTVKLEGEAFFSVAKGETFTVETELGIVQVLGTQFNVYARDGGFRVACQEGSVKVSVPGGPEITITAGQTVELDGDMLSLETELNTEEIIAWKEGEFHFKNTPYREVFAEIERQYGVTILADVSEDKAFSGQFQLGDLEMAVASVALTNYLEYEIVNEDTIRVTE
ncbi:MAG TPA: hypothetical protein DCR93_38360 [Cytophagales bacterium]|nr:hypothetical protein [Cytophagales bacterium]HAP65101.1 hypothetical protein [Cytophagales bacterium]